jgi:hypothetical protein
MSTVQSYQSTSLLKASRYAVAQVLSTTAVFAAQQGDPRPHGFVIVPIPSSLLLLLTGLVAVIGWNWAWNRWRSRSRGHQASNS